MLVKLVIVKRHISCNAFLPENRNNCKLHLKLRIFFDLERFSLRILRQLVRPALNWTGSIVLAKMISSLAIRETGVSREAQLRAHLKTPNTSQQYHVVGFKGALNRHSSMQRDANLSGNH